MIIDPLLCQRLGRFVIFVVAFKTKFLIIPYDDDDDDDYDGDDGDDDGADGVVDDDDNDDDDDVNGGNFLNRREEEGANPLIFHNEFATWMEPSSLYKQ